MVEETYKAFRSAGAEEDPAIKATNRLAEIFADYDEKHRKRESALEFIRWTVILIAGLTGSIAVKVWFF